MPQRPQPNRRRGLLRAALAIIVLLVLLVAGMLVVASATAPPATAPAVPLTPPALATPILPATPAVVLTPKPATRPKTGKGTSTTKKHKAAAGTTKAPKFLELRAGGMFREVHKPLSQSSISQTWTSPNHAWSAAFAVSGGEPTHAGLRLEHAASDSRSVFPDAYALGRPVWTSDSQHVFFLRETSIGGTPGARWSIVRASPTGRTTTSTRVDALNVALLGMAGGKLLYLVANMTDTSLYTLGARGPQLIGIPMSEPVTTAFLSPNGKYVGFASPTNCTYCNLNIYDVYRTSLWNGPTGVDNEHAFIWTPANQLVALLNHRPVVVDPVSESMSIYSRPTWFPHQLGDAWTARVHARQLTLTNATSHTAVAARETGQ